MRQPEGTPAISGQRYGRYVGVLALVILALITLNTLLSKPHGAKGIPPGQPLAPFAVPLALGDLNGDSNVATRAHEGAAGERPACQVRGARILNICELYEAGPVVLALFVDSGECPQVLSEMQSIAGEFPSVRFAGVAIGGNRGALRGLVRSRGLSFPIGYDKDGALAAIYRLASCPQITFANRGGVVQSQALLLAPPLATLRARVRELLGAAKERTG